MCFSKMNIGSFRYLAGTSVIAFVNYIKYATHPGHFSFKHVRGSFYYHLYSFHLSRIPLHDLLYQFRKCPGCSLPHS
jgi:hypothetical protein